jgi:hypothetical protein
MPNFKMGRLIAEVDFLTSVPRTAMVAALRAHAAHPETPGPIRTTHSHDGLTFHLETDADRTSTAIRLS